MDNTVISLPMDSPIRSLDSLMSTPFVSTGLGKEMSYTVKDMSTSATTGEMVHVLLEYTKGDQMLEKWVSREEFEKLRMGMRAP